ncbi:MAG: hypothetical protein Q7J26_07960 [Brevundimonas sp.]|uniref:hypothetical protein n=1 Tax=Brevundimonas sp. TaxID=1871086 RepID=UPI00272526D8|nr:hypothetical protein [Brevundimonas sp.]MDO9608443.1 hypothetical protein [Brevundimonas sp.]
MKRIIAAVGVLAAVAGPAQAQLVTRAPVGAAVGSEGPRVDITRSSAGYAYFNRAGADIDQHDAAVRACVVEARRMRQPDDNGAAGAAAAGGLLGALVVGVIQGAVNGMQERRGVAANLENCMVVNGWRVVRLEEADGKTLADLEQPALRAALATRVGADQPAGEVVRVYDNDAARGTTVVIGRSGDLDKPSLSLQSLAPDTTEPAAARKGPEAPRSARPPRAMKPEDVALTEGSALVTVRLTGMAEQGGRTLFFTRAGPRPDVYGWEADGRPALFAVALPNRGAVRGDRTRAVTQTFSVPPGRWRLSALNVGQYITHFCLGATGFDVSDGEAVYAGAFDLSGEQLAPDMRVPDDLLASTAPAATAGVRHRAAEWSYGDREQCQGAYLYALDVTPAPASPVPAVTVEATPVVVVETSPVEASQ